MNAARFADSLPMETTLWPSIHTQPCPLSSSSSSSSLSFERGRYLAHREAWQHFFNNNEEEDEEDEVEEDGRRNSNRSKKGHDKENNILMVFEDDVLSALPGATTIEELKEIVMRMRKDRIDFYYLGKVIHRYIHIYVYCTLPMM